MDLYRFFHPHHNPRLRNKPIRLQELSELELAAKELLRAMDRASIRISSSEKKFIPADLIQASSEAIELASELLHQIVDLQPEDTEEEMLELLEERKLAPGWEAWCKLLSERIEMLKNTFKKQTENQQLSLPLTNKHNLNDNSIFKEENNNLKSTLDDSSTSVSTQIIKKSVFA